MKRCLTAAVFLILCLAANISAGTAQATSQEDQKYSLYPVLLSVSEIILSNDLLWVFNRYIAEADYGMISFASVRQNITHPWVWDQDEFSVNHIGHPYQGSIYYGAGRSAGNDFYLSSLMTVFGSVSWELIMETETPSLNDLLVTTMGGISLGEMFYRLSSYMIDWPGSSSFGKVMGTVISPYNLINRHLIPDTDHKSSPLKGYYTLSPGYSFVEFSPLPPSETWMRKAGIALIHSLVLDYGNLFDRKHMQPYDWFSMKVQSGLQIGEAIYFSFDSEGFIKGSTIYGRESDSRHKLGLFLHYDFFYNEILNMASNALGPGWIWQKEISEKLSFESRLYTNLVIIGASELLFLKYKDRIDGPPGYERRNYSLSSGLNGKTEIHLNSRNRLFFDFTYQIYDFRIIESSVPYNGSDGIEIIELSELGSRFLVRDPWFIGIKGIIYHKRSFYNDYSNIDQLLWSVSLSAGVTF